MKQDIETLVEEHSDSDFAQIVEQQNVRRNMLYGTGDVACERCEKAFPTKWELNRHM